MKMKDTLKQIVIIYALFVIIKTIVAYFIPSPSIYSDEYTFAKTAYSLLNMQGYSVHGTVLSIPPPLYSMIISIAYIFKDMRVVYFFIKFINALISSLIIFPSWFLAKEFVSEKKAMYSAILVSLLPTNFIFTPFIMAENLFYPLFLFSIFFLYKMSTEKRYLWPVLAGLFVSLTYLAKAHGIALIIIPCILFIYRPSYERIKKVITFFVLSFLTLLPWIIRQGLHFGFTLDGILGRYVSVDLGTVARRGADRYFPSFVNWVILYYGYLILAGGIIFVIMSIFAIKSKNKKLRTLTVISASAVILYIFIAANRVAGSPTPINSPFPFFTWRPIGRYLEVVLPLFFILGTIGFDIYEKNIKKLSKQFTKILLGTSIILAISSQLYIAQLFPVNNMSLSFIGIFKYILDFIVSGKASLEPRFYWISFFIVMLMLFSLPFLFITLRKKPHKDTFYKISLYLAIFLIFSSLLNFSIIYYNSNTFWFNEEQMQLGHWLNSYDHTKPSYLIDERDEGIILKNNQSMLYQRHGSNLTSSIMGFWLNGDISFGDVSYSKNYDYVISKHKLDLPLVKNSKTIYIYKGTNSKQKMVDEDGAKK